MSSVHRLLMGLVLLLVAVVGLAAVRDRDSPAVQATATATPSVATTTPEPTAMQTVPAQPAENTTTGTLPESTGEFSYARATTETFGNPPYRRFVVGAEVGSGIDPTALAAFVDEVLGDPRSWIGDTVTGFERVEPNASDVAFTLVVATPATVDELCAPLETKSTYSCGHNGWIALNLTRWNEASEGWPTDLDTYRHYLVNHEVGHYIVGPDHPDCPGAGSPAPIMMQQSVDLRGCQPNGWVYPDTSG